jgi:7,8-dihydropterin-6-yl-methyl-4-(beta-D-ribofuranosyl)aminobenzene 5'-phosphate synthase
MKITILTENCIGSQNAGKCQAEWGFSAHIQHESGNILFDTGHTDLYWQNAEMLDIDLNHIDYLLLSHYHWDHCGGIKFNNFKHAIPAIFHPEISKRIPASLNSVLETDFLVSPSKKPVEFLKDIFFLGEIPKKTDFESGFHKGVEMTDDSAIAIKMEKGVFVVTGCSHSGVCNICEYACKVTGERLYGVLGGLHLFEHNPKQVKGTIEYFRKKNIKHLYPMHCVDFPTLAKFYNEFSIDKYSAGDSVIIQ